ncbi:tyrosine-type recombinase/integrase [Polaribacter sp. IC063]|uniref:tyrosine-type recombinase/integrase n=1 Tax=Polaribacter sp. IC063 TaxID=57031 RepID=UPI0011BF7808|nr:site-specific integrase [Polaribacter sp. IC063]TXD53909.1 site-specific integrase [Polaribacter sp. IC063]
MSYNISIYHETRRLKENGKFSVKLRVYNKRDNIKKVRYFTTEIDLTEQEFKTIWINPENKKLRGSNKEMELRLKAIEKRANDEAKAMSVFDFSTFESKLFRKSTDKNNVKYHFTLAIDKYKKSERLGTAESYQYTLNSFANYSEEENNRSIDKLSFSEITVDWLKSYEKFMIGKGKSYTTVGVYTRTLRAVFNIAILQKDINNDIYPFGKNKYKIPRTKKVKKALSAIQLKTLFDAKPKTSKEAEAKDFWFFSFSCYGMNIKDIALLEYSDFKNDSFSYYRSKTFDRTVEKVLITVYLTDFTKNIILKYGNKNKTGFVFNILSKHDKIDEKMSKYKNFTRKINDHLKRVAKDNELPEDISSNWARHSFATQSIRKGASMEFISEALDHSDLNVTKRYFAGFEDETKKEFANSLLDF